MSSEAEFSGEHLPLIYHIIKSFTVLFSDTNVVPGTEFFVLKSSRTNKSPPHL